VSLNFRIDNLLNENKPHYVNTLQRPPDGEVTNPVRVATPRDFWYQTPRNFNLSARVAF
jgi:hypothetical protein